MRMDMHLTDDSGMNDVLPKPFTKEGLLSMLEKHLGHLKKGHMPGMEVPSRALGHVSSRQSLKDEDSPGKSPTTLSTNWNSPGNLSGLSPVASNMSDQHYMDAVRGQAATYGGMDGAMGYQHTPLGAHQRHQQAHRRQISDITGGDETARASAKRQQMFTAPLNPLQRQ